MTFFAEAAASKQAAEDHANNGLGLDKDGILDPDMLTHPPVQQHALAYDR